MAYANLWNELIGLVPKMPPDYAGTLINRAYRDIRRQNLWSFLVFESNWTSPPVINGGTAAVNQGSPTVVFNATASPLILAQAFGPPTPVTQRQFRVGIGTIYNIWKYSADGFGVVTLTLDRNYQEPTAAAAAYSIFQCYYPAPVQDFWQWGGGGATGVRDMVNFNDLITTKTRGYFDSVDPQRTLYYIPTHVAPYQVDQNPASPTKGWQLFEMWSQPQYTLTYQLFGLRKGLPLVLPTDTLPTEIGEDVVIALATKYAWMWAEGNWQRAWGQKPNFLALQREAAADYKRLFAEYRRQDRATVDNFKTRMVRSNAWPNVDGWYSSIAGYASPGFSGW
jgi:hypothetical protein